MATVGGDLATLADLHRAFNNAAEDTVALRSRVDASLDAAQWAGPNADNFRAAWLEFKNTLEKIKIALNEGATDVKNQHNNIAAATGVTQFI